MVEGWDTLQVSKTKSTYVGIVLEWWAMLYNAGVAKLWMCTDSTVSSQYREDGSADMQGLYL